MKTFSIIFTALFCALLANAQIVNIPDANFKNALINHNPVIDTNGDGEIQLSEAQAFSGGMNVSSLNISDLTGIESFTALTELNCAANQLDSLDVSSNMALTVLMCGGNQLSTLDVSNNMALTSLWCGDNLLSTLDVSNSTALEYLGCDYNQLCTLDLNSNTALDQLRCGSNQLLSLDVNNNVALTYLSCYNNQLSTLDVSNNTALEYLGCNDNQISTLDVNNNTALTQIRCGSNQLDSLDVSSNMALTVLMCGGNQLSTLDVSNNIALEELFCVYNQISTLDVSNNMALTSLYCGDNLLSTLNVSNNTALTVLKCFWNQIGTLNVSKNTSLTDLDCGGNQLRKLDVSNNTVLTSLLCHSNHLSTIDVSNNNALTDLECSHNQLITLDVSNNAALTALLCELNQLTSLNVKNGNNSNITEFWARHNPELYCIEVDDPLWSYTSWTDIDSHTSFASNCLYGIDYPNIISGQVLLDNNCAIDGTEQGIRNIIVKTEPNAYYGITNNSGYFEVKTDTGTYNVLPLLSNHGGLLLTPLCPTNPDYHTVSFDTLAMDTTDINFYNEGVFCPYLTVDINSDRRRRCFRNNTYVKYCNKGFADASGVKVFVEFPEYVHFISADYAFTIDVNGYYVFDIGALAQGECGGIHIIDSVACRDSITGLTQCTKVWITPPNDCVNSLDTNLVNWDHSSISVSGECLGDSIIQFVITNTGSPGSGDMQSPQEYRIYADNQLCNTATFQLNGGEELIIQVSATGQTIRLEADQHPAHPGNSQPKVTIEACGNEGIPFSIGIVNAVPTDDADVNVEIDCMEIRDSYDPNDKSVSPTGITDNNYIMPGTVLDYLIRFQNTGSDTAYTVVVIDTLSNNLDVATIQWGVSSHPYHIDVSGYQQAVLKFTFGNINLPDSTTDELNSHGFVKFKIAPIDTLPLGTQINNAADIYFDYNSPIRTNTAQLIISDTVINGAPINVVVITNLVENEQFSYK
ncbi:MAG: hypothetical protein KKD31_07650, partial [Bacteroidetes bacterium]|nr:hypothetical protein [Bacteroidota bacterium]